MYGFVNYAGIGSNKSTGGIETYYKNRLQNETNYIFFTKDSIKDFDKNSFVTKIYLNFFRRRIKNLFFRNHFDWYFQLYNAIKKERINLDYIEVADSFGYGIIPYLLKIPYVVKTHTPHSVVCELNNWKKDKYYRIIKKIEKKAIKHANKIISPTKAMIDFLIKNNWKIPTERTYILNNPFFGKEIENTEHKEKQILFVGNLEPRKNLIFLLKTFISNEIFNDYSLVICGTSSFYYDKKTKQDISYWDYCCSSIPEIKCDKRIQYKGFISNEIIQDFYKNSEFFVISSTGFENFPTVVLEAFKYGTIAIGSNVGGIPEMIENGKNGFIYNDNDSVSFIQTFKNAQNCDKESIRKEAINKLKEVNKGIEIKYNNY